jgi:hypothetical protein
VIQSQEVGARRNRSSQIGVGREQKSVNADRKISSKQTCLCNKEIVCPSNCSGSRSVLSLARSKGDGASLLTWSGDG